MKELKMKAKAIYEKLDIDFEIVKYKDEWGIGLEDNEFVNPGFKERYIGVMLDNSDEIQKVYTSTFPDNIIIQKILNCNETDILLFSHHAMGYDPTLEGFPFYNMPVEYLKELKARNISFYVLHIPLDKNGDYSTSMSLARVLQLPVESEFCEYLGCKVGVICKTDFTNIKDFALYVKKTVGHDVKIRQYGDDVIKEKRVAIAAGGGCIDFVGRELSELGVNAYLTGLTKPIPSFEPCMEFHRIARENKINVVGATHYSTEKYACMAMVDYFVGLDVEAEFIEGTPFMEDL